MNYENKNLSLSLIVVFSLIAIKGCNPVVNTDTQDDQWFAEYQSTLRQVLSQATHTNKSMDISEMSQLGGNIRQAYTDVLDEYADMTAFENGYQQVERRNISIRGKEADDHPGSAIEVIIRDAETPEEALELLDELLSGNEIDDEERLATINTREFLAFLIDNSDLIDQLRVSEVRAKGVGYVTNEPRCYQETQVPDEATGTMLVTRVEVDCDDIGTNGGGGTDWKCFMGTIGGTASGAFIGCGVGAGIAAIPSMGIAAPAGCAMGTVFGGLAAFFTSYATFCF